MLRKIKIAVLDDDDSVHEILNHFYRNSQIAEISYNFTDPKKFIDAAPTLDFDICFLDIAMPGMSGLTVAQLLGKKPIIFVTASDDKLRAALDLNPIDIITKPFTQERVNRALDKFGITSIKYGIFNIAESRNKINLHIPDIQYVCVDEVDPRNKMVVIKGGLKYTLMNYSFNDLKSRAPQLIQINRHELASIDMINEVNHDSVILKDTGDKSIPRETTLTATHKPELAKRMFYK